MTPGLTLALVFVIGVVAFSALLINFVRLVESPEKMKRRIVVHLVSSVVLSLCALVALGSFILFCIDKAKQ